MTGQRVSDAALNAILDGERPFVDPLDVVHDLVTARNAMRSAIEWLECFPEHGNSDAAEEAREELRGALSAVGEGR